MHNTLLQTLRRVPLFSRAKGGFYEALAGDFLSRQGLKKIRYNYRARFGEIDLIAEDGEVLVFVEVRYRQDAGHGSPAATVDFRKQRKIIRTAQYFLQKYGLTNRMPCRFDVIGITGKPGATEIQWIKNAF